MQVHYHLRTALRTGGDAFAQFPDTELHQHGALEIKAGSTGLVSYKAPWEAGQATTALETTNMYEAGGNVMWLNPFPESADAQVIAGDPPSWSQVVEIQELHFNLSAVAAPHGKTFQHIFPIAIPVDVSSLDVVRGRTSFPGSLSIITGHVYLYAWFFGMWQALQAGNMAAVASLWRAGLTVTIHVRAGLTEVELAVLSILQSEQRKGQDPAGWHRMPAMAAALSSTPPPAGDSFAHQGRTCRAP